jgi:hypothetical protein
VAYGNKNTWGGIGYEQANRVKVEQFEENSKLCMCILKALDQEPVDLKNNRDLQSQIYTT